MNKALVYTRNIAIFIVCFLAFGYCVDTCSGYECRDEKKKIFTVELYLVGGHKKVETFYLHESSRFYLDPSDGEFRLGFRGKCWFDGLRNGVVDFKVISVK